MKKTLFVTDLDGTLLTPEQTLSRYTLDTVNALTAEGMAFTYATARSGETAAQVTLGLKISAPRVLYNGAFVVDNNDRVVLSNMFSKHDKREIIDGLISSAIYPVVYSVIGGAEKFSFLPDRSTAGCKRFLDTRKHCVRYNPVKSVRDLYDGETFYILCVNDERKLAPFYEKFKDRYNCVFQNDIYTNDVWLEIMPKAATKAKALAELKRMLDCRLVVFGDGKNDADMFRIADESYAVENACEELKSTATAVIGRNIDDSVAKQLKKLWHRN